MVKSGEMLIGNYTNRVSKKGRTAVPAKFRQQLGRQVIVTKGYEGTLLLVAQDEWAKLVESLETQSLILSPARETDRFILGNAFAAELDDQGRFVIPAALREHAAIVNEAVFVGLGQRVEIWSAKAWQAHQEFLKANSEKIADSLSQNQSKRVDA